MLVRALMSFPRTPPRSRRSWPVAMSQDRTMDFGDRVAIVTGGASGMGAATVHRLAAGGAQVVVVDRDDQKARSVAGDGGGTAMVGDGPDSSFCDAAVGHALSSHRRLDVLVNAAGVILRARGE